MDMMRNDHFLHSARAMQTLGDWRARRRRSSSSAVLLLDGWAVSSGWPSLRLWLSERVSIDSIIWAGQVNQYGMRIIAVVLNRNELNTTPQQQCKSVGSRPLFLHGQKLFYPPPVSLYEWQQPVVDHVVCWDARRSKKGDSELLINAFRNPLNWTLSAAHWLLRW